MKTECGRWAKSFMEFALLPRRLSAKKRNRKEKEPLLFSPAGVGGQGIFSTSTIESKTPAE